MKLRARQLRRNQLMRTRARIECEHKRTKKLEYRGSRVSIWIIHFSRHFFLILISKWTTESHKLSQPFRYQLNCVHVDWWCDAKMKIVSTKSDGWCCVDICPHVHLLAYWNKHTRHTRIRGNEFVFILSNFVPREFNLRLFSGRFSSQKREIETYGANCKKAR